MQVFIEEEFVEVEKAMICLHLVQDEVKLGHEVVPEDIFDTKSGQLILSEGLKPAYNIVVGEQERGE